MRIAQVAPLAESVPPLLYGGTERIVSYLTEEQVRRGHEVTLFAAGDSQTAARHIRCTSRALRLDPTVRDMMPYHFVMLDHVRECASEFDILHFHIDMMQYPLLRVLDAPAVTTLHGRLDLPDLQAFYLRFADMALVSISDASAGRCRRSTGCARSITGCHVRCCPRPCVRRDIWPFSAAFLLRSVPTGPSRSRCVPACHSRSRRRSTRWTWITGASRSSHGPPRAARRVCRRDQ